MCGIAGYWGEGSHETLEKMSAVLEHRGPDARGATVIGEVGLAHRRLSILDLTDAGSQPMSTSDGSVTIVFNGEVYNYRELKEAFLRGHTFRGTSDTEVLLHLYQELGLDFLKELSGMFALALYDRKRDVLVLARDHFGKKPLYWTHQHGAFIFGSELKALREHPLCPKEMDRDAIAEYLVYEYIPSPKTIYQGVQKLEPGTHLIFDGASARTESYWSPESKQGTYKGSFEDAKGELDTLLDHAVEKRLVSDVPLGVFLSGGLDSSAIAYYAAKHTDEKLKTFSIGFEEKSFDERSYADQVATHLGTEHHELVVGTSELLGLIDSLPEILDEPMADASIIPTTVLSQFARAHVTVCLGGDGADELFFGYGTFLAHKGNALYGAVPLPFIRAANRLVQSLPVSHRYMSFDFKLKKFMSGIDQKQANRNTYWLGSFQPEELEEILNFETSKEQQLSFVNNIYSQYPQFIDGLQHEYLRGYLAEDILVKADRASMSCGLEVRAPFLDREVADFALTLGQKYKYRGLTAKYILKQVMEERLPKEIVGRTKKGFGIPLGLWIQNELRELFQEKVVEGPLVRSGLFKREALATLLQAHLGGRVDNRKKLWTLLVLALWMERWEYQR